MESPDLSACSFCRQVFPTAHIETWWDGGVTPVCPLCGVDCVTPGDATPGLLLSRHRVWFGHPPGESDPPALRELQRLSEQLTVSPGDVAAAALIDAIGARASLARELDALSEQEVPYQLLWVALMGIDRELDHHRGRFQELDVEARIVAWQGSTLEPEHMPHWCRPEQARGISAD